MFFYVCSVTPIPRWHFKKISVQEIALAAVWRLCALQTMCFLQWIVPWAPYPPTLYTTFCVRNLEMTKNILKVKIVHSDVSFEFLAVVY